jgi:hypothetical protein
MPKRGLLLLQGSTIGIEPVVPSLVPQLVGNDGIRALRAAIADPERWALEPKVDGVRGLLVFDDGRLELATGTASAATGFAAMRSRTACAALAALLPILWRGSILDGDGIADASVFFGVGPDGEIPLTAQLRGPACRGLTNIGIYLEQ